MTTFTCQQCQHELTREIKPTVRGQAAPKFCDVCRTERNQASKREYNRRNYKGSDTWHETETRGTVTLTCQDARCGKQFTWEMRSGGKPLLCPECQTLHRAEAHAREYQRRKAALSITNPANANADAEIDTTPTNDLRHAKTAFTEKRPPLTEKRLKANIDAIVLRAWQAAEPYERAVIAGRNPGMTFAE